MKTKYRIHTTTSDFPDAGFNSNVYVQIFGSIKTRRSSSPSSKNKNTKSSSKLVSFRFPLQISKNNAQKFRPGQTDLFEFEEETEIDKIKKIRLTHDSRNSRWHLKKLVVELVDEDEEGRKKEASVNRKWTFDCSQWIDGSDSGVELSPSKLKNDSTMSNTEETDDEFDSDSSYFSDDESRAKRKEKKKKEKEKEKNKGKDMAKVRYKIKIVTNAISKIEPDMKIKIKLVGVNGETGWIRVEEFPAIHIFKAEENDVGMIDRLIISSQNKENGKPIDWYYDEIVVSVHKFKTFIFNSKGRSIIDIDKEKNRLLNEIFPTEIQDISKKINYTVSFYSRTRPLVSNEILVKLYGEFGNSGEFKTKLVKSEQKCKKIFAKNILVNFSQKFFDFGKVYKIDLGLIEPKNVKKDLECLTRSFIVLTHGKQQYNLFYIKNKSIKKDKDDKGSDDESDDTNAVKIVFYEQEYMKKQFADELVHDMLFDEPKRRRKSQSKDDKKHVRRRSDGSSGSRNRSSESLQRRKHEYDDYSSFESDRDSRDRRYSPQRQNRSTGSIERYSPRSKPKSSGSIDRYSPRRQRDRSPSIDRYSPRPKTKSAGSIDRYSPQRRKDRSPSIDRYSPRSKTKSSGSVDRYSPRRQRDRSPSIDRYSPRRAYTRDSYKSKSAYDDYIDTPSKTKPKPNKYDFDEPDYKYNDNIRKSNNNKKIDFDETRDYNYNDYNRKSNYNKKYEIDEIDYFGRKDDDYGYKRNKDKEVFDSRKIRYNEPPKSSVRPSVKINLDAY